MWYLLSFHYLCDLGHIINICTPWFPHQKDGGSKSTYTLWLFQVLNMLIHVKCLDQCLGYVSAQYVSPPTIIFIVVVIINQ